MKTLLVVCFLLAGCATQARREQFRKERFVKLDQGFQANSRADLPRVFVDADELTKEKAPPHRFIGVVEVEGIQTEELATWQFLCGVGGATQEQAELTFKQADALAVRMRVAVLGFEPCVPFTPLGSHIRKARVCADDPKGRNRPDSTSFDR